MPNIIDSSFFVGDLNIPNTGQAEISQRVSLFINKYEKKLLVDILGYELWKSYNTDPTTDRMVNLINGTEYIDMIGKTRFWEGLKHDTNQSLIADYVYYMLQESMVTNTTGVATVIQKGEAAQNVSPKDKMISAWNDMSCGIYSMVGFLLCNLTVYPEYDYCTGKRVMNKYAKINYLDF